MIPVKRLALLGTLIISSCAAVHGAQIAFDSAGDSAYSSGWTQGSNGGFGWGSGWNFNVFNVGQPIIGDSTTNGFGAPDGTGDINSPRTVGGRAWGLPAGDVTRTFGSPLSLGETFSIDFDDFGGESINHRSSVYLLAPSGAEAVGVEANHTIPDYMIQGTIDSGVPETDQGIHIDFTELSSGVQVSITPYSAGAITSTTIVPYTGQLSGIEFHSYQLANTFPATLTPYINNMAITPEPSGVGLLALTLPALIARRRQG